MTNENNLTDLTEWYPRALADRSVCEWPPIPTVESLSYWLCEAIKTGDKYRDDTKYRKIIDTAAYCLDEVPTDIAENALYRLSVIHRTDPSAWQGTFNQLASILWRPPVREHEVRLALMAMLQKAA
ncbi:hypothetical protein WMC41_11820 [Shinella yambaruensis]|uniref:hypothetical protein n=1 Tax=Shinella yambaruensis TaxID=415996 RepID=UPI003D7BE9CF